MQVSNSIHFKSGFLNSKGENIDPKTREKPIDDAIGNNPDNAIDFVADTGERVTISKKVFMGILNSVYHMDTSISKQDFVDAAADAGILTDGLAHPISKSEFLAYMNEHDDAPAADNNATFTTLYKVGGKLTKEELLELLKKSIEEKKLALKNTEQIHTKEIQQKAAKTKVSLESLSDEGKNQNTTLSDLLKIKQV